MNPLQQDPKWARFLVPNALFVGAFAGFAACCLAGLLASRQHPIRNVERFHFFLTPETLFCPTVNQMCGLAEDRLPPGKIAVIVGGTSRLHGTCQPLSQVWTRKLQDLLGDEYEVINFGFRCARTAEIGATAAEALSRKYSKVILVADCYPGFIDPHPDGLMFRYFFWDAYFKQLLYPDPERAQRLREETTEIRHEEQKQGGSTSPYDDLKLRMRLDSLCYFTDFWNTVAYQRFFTLWTPWTPGTPAWPRRKYADPDPGALPLEQRYPEDFDIALGRLRSCLPLRVRDGSVCQVEAMDHPVWRDFERALRTCFAAPLRPRTVMVALRFSSYYGNRLTPDEQDCLDQAMHITVDKCEAAGFTALEAGRGYDPEDYADWQHLSESGGAKLAGEVAPKVRELARRLGYTH
jgi:hypothetical protein